MKNRILNFQLFSAIFAIILGTILHFTYEWSGNNYIVGAFSAVNESTWEHLKLAFVPMLITTIIGYFYLGKSYSKFLCAKSIGIVSAILFIVIFFYTYTGVFGTNISFFNIASFFVAIILGEFIAYKFTISNYNCLPKISIVFLIILTLLFIGFTYVTPKINLFKDPITNLYGITAKRL